MQRPLIVEPFAQILMQFVEQGQPVVHLHEVLLQAFLALAKTQAIASDNPVSSFNVAFNRRGLRHHRWLLWEYVLVLVHVTSVMHESLIDMIVLCSKAHAIRPHLWLSPVCTGVMRALLIVSSHPTVLVAPLHIWFCT